MTIIVTIIIIVILSTNSCKNDGSKETFLNSFITLIKEQYSSASNLFKRLYRRHHIFNSLITVA